MWIRRPLSLSMQEELQEANISTYYNMLILYFQGEKYLCDDIFFKFSEDVIINKRNNTTLYGGIEFAIKTASHELKVYSLYLSYDLMMIIIGRE
jgi:hypothetical protein